MLCSLLTICLARQLDDGLQTREGPARTFLILARYASRTVYEEQLEAIKGSLLWPMNALGFLRAWAGYKRLDLKLTSYEMYLSIRRLFGLGPLII